MRAWLSGCARILVLVHGVPIASLRASQKRRVKIVLAQFGLGALFSLRNFASALGDLRGSACLLRLTAKCAKGFAKDAKQTDPLRICLIFAAIETSVIRSAILSQAAVPE
jgi:hypothetical protein